MAYRDFTEFPVWKRALDALLLVYKMTKMYPAEEKFGLVSDMRRASNSVLHNIAEGFGRYESKDKTRFYKVSRGSSYEIISQLYASLALKYITVADQKAGEGLYRDIIADLDRLIKSVEKTKRSSS